MIGFTNMEDVGFIPLFLYEDDPRSAKEQIHERYAFGGGWNKFDGFELHQDYIGKYSLRYPKDPPMKELSRGLLRKELLVFFEGSWLAIIQPDRSWEVARLD